MAGMSGPTSRSGPIDPSTFRFGAGGAPGAPVITGGDAAGPWASASTDEDRLAIGGSKDWGKTTAQKTGFNPVQAWWGELQPGSADGSGGVPPGATPSYNPASGKVEWMTLSQDKTPQGGGSDSSMQGLMAAGAGGGGGTGAGGGGDYAPGPMVSDPGGAGGAGGPGGAKVVDPASNNASMQGLMAAGSGDSGASGANMLEGPSHFRRGIGARMLPNEMSPLAGNRKIY